MELVEFIKQYCDTAVTNFAKQGMSDRVNVLNIGMEHYQPRSSFDCFWIQWCIGHLVDLELVDLLERLKRNLAHNGFIVIKDNFASTEKTGFI